MNAKVTIEDTWLAESSGDRYHIMVFLGAEEIGRQCWVAETAQLKKNLWCKINQGQES